MLLPGCVCDGLDFDRGADQRLPGGGELTAPGHRDARHGPVVPMVRGRPYGLMRPHDRSGRRVLDHFPAGHGLVKVLRTFC